MVGLPAEADFIFEIRFTNPSQVESKWVDKDDPLEPNRFPRKQERVEYTVHHPQVRLVILDRRTHGVLGAFTELVEIELGQDPRDAFRGGGVHEIDGGAFCASELHGPRE